MTTKKSQRHGIPYTRRRLKREIKPKEARGKGDSNWTSLFGTLYRWPVVKDLTAGCVVKKPPKGPLLYRTVPYCTVWYIESRSPQSSHCDCSWFHIWHRICRRLSWSFSLSSPLSAKSVLRAVTSRSAPIFEGACAEGTLHACVSHLWSPSVRHRLPPRLSTEAILDFWNAAWPTSVILQWPHLVAGWPRC